MAGLALHRVDGPLVRSALALWADGPDGLGWRFPEEGPPPETPLVQVIFSREDWEEVMESGGAGWPRATIDTLRRLVHQRGIDWPERVPGPWIELLPDASPRLGRHALGLERGQFASVVLPHRWPDPASWPKGAARTPVRRVVVSTLSSGDSPITIGWLWRGQRTWTLGSDWLDSARLPAGGEPAVISIEQAEDGRLTVRAAAGLEATLTPDGKKDIITARADGAVVMQLVVEAARRHAGPQGDAARAPGHLGPPEHATLADMLDANDTAGASERPPSETLFHSEPLPAQVTLAMTGLLLPVIAFPDLFDGYERGLAADGQVRPSGHKDVVAVVRVLRDRIELEARGGGVSLSGQLLRAGSRGVLRPGMRIGLPSGRELDLAAAPGDAARRYRGVLRGMNEERMLAWGRRYTFGRGPNADISLMDDSDTEGLIWKPALRSVGSVRVSGGMVPRNRFRLDAVLVSADHAALDLRQAPALVARSRRASVWAVRGSAARKVAHDSPPEQGGIEPGDELWVGHQCFALLSSSASLANPLSLDVGALLAASREAAQAVRDELDQPPTEAPRPRLPRAIGRRPTLVADDQSLGGHPASLGPVRRPANRSRADPADVPVGRPPTFIPSDEPMADTGPPPATSPGADGPGGEDPNRTLDLPDTPGGPGGDAAVVTPPPAPVHAASIRSASTIPGGLVEVPVGGSSRAEQVAVCVDEVGWDWELSRPYLLRLEGWLLPDGASIGTGSDADVILPLLGDGSTTVPAVRYAEVRIGRRSATFALPTPVAEGVKVEAESRLVVERRDESGALDHAVSLTLERPAWSRNPRHWLLRLDGRDPVARALFDRGVEVGGPRTLRTQASVVQVVGLPEGGGVAARRISGQSVHIASEGGRLRALASADEIVPSGGRIRVGSAVYVVEAG